jgi:hypothetical protein
MTDIQDIDLNNDGIPDADLNQDGILTQEEIELYRKHVIQYFDNQLKNDILNLNDEDKSRFFEMAEKYADIFMKLFHKGNNLFEYILYGDEQYFAKQDPHEGINWDYECDIVKQYKQWKETQQ